MEHRVQRVFLFLILAQAAHSAEECLTRLYEVFAPARFVSSLFSSDLALGFLIANAALVMFGLWCWAIPVRLARPSAPAVMWFWTILELGNGLDHSLFALLRRGYFPGVATAPLLLLFAGWLAFLNVRQVRRAAVLPS